MFKKSFQQIKCDFNKQNAISIQKEISINKMHFILHNKKRSDLVLKQKQKSTNKYTYESKLPQSRVIPSKKIQYLQNKARQIDGSILLDEQPILLNVKINQIQDDKQISNVKNELTPFYSMNPFRSFMKIDQINQSPIQSKGLKHQGKDNYSTGKKSQEKSLNRVQSKPIQPMTNDIVSEIKIKRKRKNSELTNSQIYVRPILHTYPTQLSSKLSNSMDDRLQQYQTPKLRYSHVAQSESLYPQKKNVNYKLIPRKYINQNVQFQGYQLRNKNSIYHQQKQINSHQMSIHNDVLKFNQHYLQKGIISGQLLDNSKNNFPNKQQQIISKQSYITNKQSHIANQQSHLTNKNSHMTPKQSYVKPKQSQYFKGENSAILMKDNNKNEYIRIQEDRRSADRKAHINNPIQIQVKHVKAGQKPFVQSKYHSYIQLQQNQLHQQRQRMLQLTQQADKVIFNQDSTITQTQNINLDNDVFVTVKHLFNQVVDLFVIAEVIKFQLKYRSYEILNKIYAQASIYYQHKIQVEQPIKAKTFAIALKGILIDYQRKDINVIIYKIFHQKPQLTYDQFFKQFQSTLNSKQAKLFQPESMKRELDKTLQKTKRLFIIFLELDYFIKKTKNLLIKNTSVLQKLFNECSNQDDQSLLDIQLIERLLMQNSKKNQIKKLKIDVFFRYLLGNSFQKANFTKWVYQDDYHLENDQKRKKIFKDQSNQPSSSNINSIKQISKFQYEKSFQSGGQILQTSRKFNGTSIKNISKISKNYETKYHDQFDIYNPVATGQQFKNGFTFKKQKDKQTAYTIQTHLLPKQQTIKRITFSNLPTN